MTPEQFTQLVAAGYNRIPVMREVLADLDTPLSAYLKLADGEYTYLFESMLGGEKWGRYSFIGLPAKTVIKVFGYEIQISESGCVTDTQQVTDPLQWIADYQQQFCVPDLPHLPRFTGGLVGYFGYDTIRYIEPRLAKMDKPDPLATPDILLMLSEEVIAFDNLQGKLYLIVHANPAQENALAIAEARLDQLVAQLQAPLSTDLSSKQPQALTEADFSYEFAKADHAQAIKQIKHYIVEGDAMQVVLAQRLSMAYTAPPLDVYRALRCLNPSPYMYYLNLADFHIAGSSPEILVRLEDGQVTVRPIAGTRPRGATPVEDSALETDLLADPKELAEHLMLIDLGRNDVGRVAEIGSVKVTDQMIIERYSHVMHIVSNVTAQLKPNMAAIDVLKATFPAGTLSGAPKIRAMEIIDELEPVKRGVYGGAVGYIGWQGDMDTAIAIRTGIIKQGRLYVQAGGGIVADSVAETEWQETINKGRAVCNAALMAAAGLR